jgi:hypothetical protein
VLVGDFDEFFKGFDGGFEFFGEFRLFGVLPGVAERGEAGLKAGEVVLEVAVETFEFLRETAHLIGVHDCLSHGKYLHEELLGLKGNVGGEGQGSRGVLVWRDSQGKQIDH